jgi:hypothetical protein
VLFPEEVLLAAGDLVQRVGAGHHGMHFAALDVRDQVFEHVVFLERAAEHRQVPEVQRPEVDLRDRTSDGARDRVAAACAQQVQQVRELRAADEIDHHVDGALAEGTGQVCSAVDGVVRSLRHDIGGLGGRADRDDRRGPTLRELHRGESDSTGSARHQHALRPNAGSVQHVLRGRVRARHGCEFFIAPVAADGVRLPGGRHRELCESAVAFTAERPALVRPIVDRRAQHVPHQDPLADAPGADILAHLDDAAADVGALDARELESGTRPCGVRVVDGIEAGQAAVAGAGVDRSRVPPDAGVHVGVVDSCCGDLDKHLTSSRAGNRYVRPVLEPIQPTMAGEEDGGHRPGQHDRAPSTRAGNSGQL